MLIRSQDKRVIVLLGNCDVVCVNKISSVYHIVTFNGTEDSRTSIGKYSTEEKAIKVLDMIQEKYLSRMELDGGFDAVSGCYVQPNFGVLPRVFQMPQDSEVQL